VVESNRMQLLRLFKERLSTAKEGTTPYSDVMTFDTFK
jgi:hypothetical protein